MGSDESLLEVLIDRLDRSALSKAQQILVLAAFEGDEQLERALEGAVDLPRSDGDRPVTKTQAAHAYLRKITVRGFRGIGAEASLQLQRGPGLTLVVGRNGSGKSSFAEAVEIALTGTSFRWKDRTKDWKSGWRNLHEGDTASVALELDLEGDRGPTHVVRTWAGDDVDHSESWGQRHGQRKAPLSDLGWEPALETFRPFLSYSELGQIIAGRPSDMYDALSSILGLDQITIAEHRLNEARKRLDSEVKEPGKELPSLLAELEAVNDERARATHAALSGKRKDLDKAAALAAGATSEEPSEEIRVLRRMAQLDAPDPEIVNRAIANLRRAAEALTEVRGTEADDSRVLAELLERSLSYHERHTDRDACPVCGTEGVLDAAWADRTRQQIGRLRSSAESADSARREARDAVARGRALATPPPSWLPSDSPVRKHWIDRAAAAKHEEPAAMADHLERTSPRLRDACDNARRDAQHRLTELEDRWRPVAIQLGAWVERARRAERSKALRDDVKKAYDWLRDTGVDLRNDRLRPLAGQSSSIWGQLRQESSVDLGPITLQGKPGATNRRVALDVTVDGTDASALGVMSQGELHALALALFLPRAMMPESPFGFLVIDDPVQSMDPAKVDGLARVLSETAKSRQVIVFTHDTRLPAAIRRLDLPAIVWEVARRENSVVELRTRFDPATRALDDARALLSTQDLPDAVAPRVVPGFCRTALEAALNDLVWRRRLAAGISHTAIEDEIRDANTPVHLAALAFYGDTGRSGDVLTRINQYGRWAGDAFVAAKSAGHSPHKGDLRALVNDTERLVKELRAER